MPGNVKSTLISKILDELFYRIVAVLHSRSVKRGLIPSPMILSSSDVISHRLISTGSFEATQIEGLDLLIEDSEEAVGIKIDWSGIFIDVGSNIGIYSIRYAPHFEKTLAVEANPLTYNILKANLELSQTTNVIPLCVGASNKHGTASLQVPIEGNLGWSTVNTDATWATRSVQINLSPLDDLVEENARQNKVKLLKVDVEGHELQALEGAKQILCRDGPVVLYEALSNEAGRSCAQLLLSCGYSQFYTMRRHFGVASLWRSTQVRFHPVDPSRLKSDALICAIKP